jgi:UDP-N-acetylmuramyl tripeptide synthase
MILEEVNHGKLWVVVTRGGEGEIGWTSEHNGINFSNATIVATYKVFLFNERQKKDFDYRDKKFKL